MEDSLILADMELAEALLERDGTLPDVQAELDRPVGPLPLTSQEADVLGAALEGYFTDDPEDAEIAHRLLTRVNDL